MEMVAKFFYGYSSGDGRSPSTINPRRINGKQDYLKHGRTYVCPINDLTGNISPLFVDEYEQRHNEKT
jgi:hypothetical protein